MAKVLRTKMSKSILMRLVDDCARVEKERDEYTLEWGWLEGDDESEPKFASFPISEGLFNKLKADGLIKCEDSDPGIEVEWWVATPKAGATLYPDKAEYYLGKPEPTIGVQEPPQDYRIFNRKQPDGTYRPISEFFEGK